ncbi:MAG: carbamoyltransferase C-terminal domain-containing protein [Synechococcaceae cyanobacterium]|nr:carbamoyltransferase C-terminal domain-containing protein [Synechococcaceae cyanobacterium]
MALILGINAFHADAAAALVRDGTVVAAAEEERFRRIKHWAGFPSQAIRWCLHDAGVSAAELEHVAINALPSAHRWRKLAYTLAHRPDPRFLWQKWRNKRERSGLGAQLQQVFPEQRLRAELHFIEHHRAHLASAFYASPFEEAAVVSVDGFGDFASSAWGLGSGSSLSLDGQVHFPHSLGAFYTAITQFLGFPHYGDEYKVMGLAPYGSPTHLEAMRQLVRLQPDGRFRLDLRYFRHATQRLPHQWSDGMPEVGAHWSEALESLLGPARQPQDPLEQRHRDIARSCQAMYEEAFFHLLQALHRLHPSDRLCIAGGCGANSVANGKVTLATPFRQVWVQAAAGDAGGAIGAALEVWHRGGGRRGSTMTSAYLGCAASPEQIHQLLAEAEVQQALQQAGCQVEELPDAQLCEQVAAAIAAGQVVGWFEGRMEWGPRALGHRSILGDPRRADMKDILNLKIKRRESFRPFAPSVLREAVAEWFELDGDVPFMMQVYPIRADKRPRIPAVTHVDGSGRLQTVSEEANGRYYRLIRAFQAQTGVPMVLNTSFNENEPIVAVPRQALDCFLRTRMDLLVLEDTVIRRQAAAQPV